MRNRDLLSGLFLTLLCIGACIKAFQLDLGSGSTPGPGFIPFGIGALLGLMSLYLCLRGLIQVFRRSGEKAPRSKKGWKKAMLVLAVLAAYGASFHSLGFPLATFLLMMLLLWAVGRQKLLMSLGVSALTVLCAHGLFVLLFSLPLPRGALWEWLGK